MCSKIALSVISFFLSSRFFNFHSNLSHSKKFLCNLYTCLLHTILIYLLGKIKLHQHKLTDAIYWLFYMQYLLGLFLSIICWCCLCTDLDRYLCHGNNSILLSHNILFFWNCYFFIILKLIFYKIIFSLIFYSLFEYKIWTIFSTI